MIPIVPIVLVTLVWFLNKQESGQSDNSTKPVKNGEKHERNSETGSDNRASSSGDLPSATDSLDSSGLVTEKPNETTSNNNALADSVETVGEELNTEQNNHASRKATKNTNDDPILSGEPGTETIEPGDAISTVETPINGSPDTDSGE